LTIDFEQLAKNGMPAEKLANVFLKEYFLDREIIFPINPFQMLREMGVMFTFRPFNKYEGIYIPKVDEEDFPIVGINVKRPITRQRFTAAHELCHHLKDANGGFMCTANAQSEVERYAENFAAELLMPSSVLRKQVEKYEVNGYIEFDDVLKMADYFGVSFLSCLYRIAYRLHKIKGDTSKDSLSRRAKKYKPAKKRKEFALYDTVLYEQLFNSMGDCFEISPSPYACQKFKINYIYNDSRLEGVDIDKETVTAIVMDLRLYKQKSVFCKETNKNIIEVAGLTLVYDYAFENAETEISVYDAKHINEKLFSTAVFPEYGGRYRESNTLVLGAKFETIDYKKIQEEMYFLDKDISAFMKNSNQMPISEYVENVIRIHHRLTVIHAFRDGNGRTSRAFANMMLLKRHIPPVFFRSKEKDEYKDALAHADNTNTYDFLYERFYKSILNSYVELTDFNIE
jgi:Zn-dependent peptidase ImmA (M78 family)/fido (protein-threonine AMPylation protein)